MSLFVLCRVNRHKVRFIRYYLRLKKEGNMTITASTILKTDFGDLRVSHHEVQGEQFVSFAHGEISTGRPLIRIQSACLFGQTMLSRQCDCRWQLQSALSQIAAGNGVVVYSPRGEGKGAGLGPKVRAMELERVTGCSPVEAYQRLGLPADLREFEAEAQVCVELGVSKRVRTSTENERKLRALRDAGFEIVS